MVVVVVVVMVFLLRVRDGQGGLGDGGGRVGWVWGWRELGGVGAVCCCPAMWLEGTKLRGQRAVGEVLRWAGGTWWLGS